MNTHSNAERGTRNAEQLPPGLPPGAVRIDERGLLDAEIDAGRLRHVIIPCSLYEAGLLVNGLAVLEGVQDFQGQHNVARECNGLQRILLQSMPFGPRVRAQMAANRRHIGLPDL